MKNILKLIYLFLIFTNFIYSLDKRNVSYKDFQVGFLALNKAGEYGAYSLQKGFDYAVCVDNNNKLLKSESYS